MPFSHRVRQTFAALTARPDKQCESLATTYLTAVQASAFRRLPLNDQAHLCRVTQELISRGEPSSDLIVAALLHDIGKVSSRGRVRLPDRIAKVLLSKFSPNLLARLATPPVPRWREGLSLAVHHPALGTTWATELGCSERTCWLIAHHEDSPPIVDKELCLLVAADRETV